MKKTRSKKSRDTVPLRNKIGSIVVDQEKDNKRRKITVTSSVKEIFMDQLGNRVRLGGKVLLCHPHPFLQKA
jgi:hypothetical protein